MLQNENVALKSENFGFFENTLIFFPKLKLVLMASKLYGLMNVVMINFFLPCNCFKFHFFHLIAEDKEQDIPLFKTALKSTLKNPGQVLCAVVHREEGFYGRAACYENLIAICVKFPFLGNLQRVDR